MPEAVPLDQTNYGESYVPPWRARPAGESVDGRSRMCSRRSVARSAGAIIAGAVLASIVACVIVNFGDIRRYVRISTM